MATTVESVRLAMNAVAEAPPAERRQRIVELFSAAVALKELVTRYHDWLVKEDAWLEANHKGHHTTELAFLERETRYLERVLLYQEACDVLAGAYEVGKEAKDGSIGRTKRPVQAVLGEAPF